MTKGKLFVASIIASLIILTVFAMAGFLYAQTAAVGDIPLLGKLQKGFVDPNSGVIDSWHVDYDSAVTPPTGARATGTVWHHLNTLAAISGTSVTASATSFPSNNVDGSIFMASGEFTVSGGVAQDGRGVDITQIEQGDVYRYNSSNSHWITVTGFGYIHDDAILERMLKIQGNPAIGECLSWDGVDLEWSTCATGAITVADGSITTIKLADSAVSTPKLANSSVTEIKLASGSVTTTKLADGVVTTVKIANSSVTENKLANDAVTSDKIDDDSIAEVDLDIHTPPMNGYVLEYSSSNGMQWTSVGTVTLADSSVTTAKILDGTILRQDISISGTWQAGYILVPQTTGTADGFEWVADITASTIGGGAVGTNELADDSVTSAKIADGQVGTTDLANDSVTEPKLAVSGTPTNAYAILWDGSGSGGMQWATAGTDTIANNAITEPKLAMHNVPGGGQTILWNNTDSRMEWGAASSSTIGTNSITTDKLDDGAVTEPKLADNAVSTRTIADDAVTSAQIGDDQVTGTELAGDSVTSSHIVDGAVAESDLAITNTATSSSSTGFQITWAGSAMSWKAAYENVIRLLTTLPSTAAQILAADEAELIGEIETTGDALNALYYKGESDADEIQIRMDDITDRSHFAIGRAIGYNSGSVQPSLYGKGGAIFPTDPPGLTLLIEVEVGGGDWHMQMQWGSPDTPSFGTTTGSVIYIQYQLAGTTSSTRQKMTLEAGAGWTSHPSGSGYATQKFTPHSTYIFSFYDAASGGTKYTIPDVIEDHLAKLVDERHLQDSDGKIIDRINDVYTKTAHGSYRGDFDATRAEGYGKGDVVTAKGSETGSAQTDANTVIYIARNNITKGSGDLDQPHEDDGNWLEISNGFEDVLLNEALVDASAMPADVWNAKGLDRAITADDNERNIVLEFEHTTSTTQINAPSTFTHVVMGPVDRWLSLTAKSTSEENFEETMCGMMPGPFMADFLADPNMNVVCIARNAGNYGMLIYVQDALPSVRTYITLK